MAKWPIVFVLVAVSHEHTSRTNGLQPSEPTRWTRPAKLAFWVANNQEQAPVLRYWRRFSAQQETGIEKLRPLVVQINDSIPISDCQTLGNQQAATATTKTTTMTMSTSLYRCRWSWKEWAVSQFGWRCCCCCCCSQPTSCNRF